MIEEPTGSSNKNDDAGVVAPSVPPKSLPAIAGTGTKRLFLVRHGEVVNPGGSVAVYYGAMDVPLSFLGQKEAVAAAKYLAQYDLSAVFCSPLSRAYYGAQQVAYRQKDPDTASGPIKLDGFKELERGYWRGKSKQQIGERLVAAFDAGDPKATPMGGESYRELNQRVLKALDKVMETLQPGQAAAIVSHLQVTRCIVAAALGVPLDQLTNIKISTASITCIDYVPSVVPQTIVHFQSFKPSIGLAESADGAN
jgi:ribonuclease H / adenosylcobalamin/alpha-ribazole phosphatase